MFEREIQFIYDFNQNKVKRLGSFMTFEQLEETDVHPAILQYISGEIDFLIFEDRQKLLKESLFDYSGEKVSEHFAAISGEIKRTKRFSLNYVEKLILHASSFTINYLSRPKWSILKFIFDEEKNKSALEIKQIFNYFYYYPYLRKIVLSYIDKKKVVSISFDEFKALLEKIDNISLESNHMKVIGEALDSLSGFVNAGLSKRKLIPLQAVQYFLAEKSLDPFLAKLEQDYNNPEITRYELNDLKNSLKEVVFEIEGGSLPTGDDPFMADDDFHPAKIDTFGGDVPADVQEEPQPVQEEPPVGNEFTAPEHYPASEEIVVPEIEPEDQTLDSSPLMYSDSDEIDLAEDSRGDGEVLEDLTEVVKEEKEELEIENLQKTDSDIVPQGNSFDDDTEEDEFLGFKDEQIEESESAEDGLDAAKALYMDEVIVEEANEAKETVAEEIESDEPELEELAREPVEEEPEDEPEEPTLAEEVETVREEELQINELESYSEPDLTEVEDEESALEHEESSVIPDEESPSEENELNDVPDKLVQEVEQVAENPVSYETEQADEDDVTIDSLLDDVEELLDKNENDLDASEFEDEIKPEDIPEFDNFAKEPDPVDLYEEDENVDSVPEEIEEDEPDDEEKDVFEDIESSGLLSEDSGINDILGEEDENEKTAEDLKLFDDNDFINEIDDEKDKINEIADEYIRGEEPQETQPKKIDLGELLENKKMNKIIDSIFDYDMEDFAYAIEKIVEAESVDEAHSIVDKICLTAQVSPTSKEAKLFKSIISEYFEQT